MQDINTIPYAFSAPEADQALISLAEKRKAERPLAINWSDAMPTLQKFAPPIFQGQTCVLQAATGEGKSLFASWWTRQVADILQLSGDKEARVLYAVLEESIEFSRARTMRHPVDFKEISMGTADLAKVKVAMSRSADDPIVYVGPSLSGAMIDPRASTFSGLRPKDLAAIAFELSNEQEVDIRACVIDYIQKMNDNNGTSERVMSVAKTSIELLNVQSSVLRCPTLICAQSKPEVKSRTDKIPQDYDIQWSSQIAQDVDINIGWWYPMKNHSLGETVEVSGVNVPVFKDIFIMRVNKWRHGDDVVGRSIVVNSYHKGIRGNLHEISKDDYLRVNMDLALAEGIVRYCDLTERHFM